MDFTIPLVKITQKKENEMKKILITLVLLVLLITSCNKKVDTTTSNPINQDKVPSGITAVVTDAPTPTATQQPESEKSNNKQDTDSKYPISFSWKSDEIIMTPQNQDPLGSCAVFATMSMFETHIAMTTGELIDLSEMHFVLTSEKWSNDTGVSPEVVLDFITTEGIVTEEKMPYKPHEASAEPVENDYGYDYILDVNWGSEVLADNPSAERIEAMKRNLLEHGPVVTNVALHNDFGYYRKGIYECDESSGVAGGHWLVILGWKDAEDIKSGGYWICKNSWGPRWGEGGFCNIAYDDPSGIDDYILYYIDTPKDNVEATMNNLDK